VLVAVRVAVLVVLMVAVLVWPTVLVVLVLVAAAVLTTFSPYEQGVSQGAFVTVHWPHPHISRDYHGAQQSHWFMYKHPWITNLNHASNTIPTFNAHPDSPQ
jgi:hypothetical protein